MGIIQHDAIIITGMDYESSTPVMEAYNVAVTMFPTVSPILNSETNGYTSFFIPPDGSKEGWDTSNHWNQVRINFLKQISQLPIDVITVTYGEQGTSATNIYESQDKR